MGINKGTISALYNGGKTATVKPYLGEVVTPELVVPFFLFECLEVGMAVVYATFKDNTGVVLARMDGEWNHKLYDGVEIASKDVKITGGDLITGSVPSYKNHTHGYSHGGTSAGADTTEPPK